MPVISSTSTILNYAIAVTPDPLQVSTLASITIVASKHNQQPAVYNQLQLQIPDTLAIDLSNIQVSAPSTWTVTSPGNQGNTFTFTPPSGATPIQPTDALMFVLSKIPVVSEVGDTAITLSEFVNGNSTPNTLIYPLSKFLQGVVLTQLKATPPIVAVGGQSILSWTGSGEGNCTLQYGDQTIPIPAGTNQYPVSNLQHTTTFALSMKDTTDNVQTERQCTVTVRRPEILNFGVVGGQTEVAAGSQVNVSWQTQYVKECDLYVNGVYVNRYAYPTQECQIPLPFKAGTVELFLRAYDSTGTISTTASLSLLLYQFKSPLNCYPVGVVQPFQVVPSVDGSRLYVVGNYPGNLLTGAIDPSKDTSSAVQYLDLEVPWYPSHALDCSNYLPIFMDSNTSSISRLAVYPDDPSYLFWAKNVNGNAVRIDTTNLPPQQKWSAVYAVATGTNNQNQFLAVGYDSAKVQVMVGAYNVADLSIVEQMDIPSQTISWNGIWNVAANSTANTLLITTSLNKTPDQNLYRYDVSTNMLAQVKLPNCYRSTTLPSYVVYNPNDACYYVSGVDPTTNSQPVIAVVNAADNSLVRSIPMPAQVRAMAASPDAYHLYATLADNSIVRINTGIKGGVVGTLKIQLPDAGTPVFWGLAVDITGTQLFVTDIQDQKQTGNIWAIEIADDHT